MRKLLLLLLTCCFMTASWVDVKSAQPHIIIINPGLSDKYTVFGNWGDLIESHTIYKWGRSHNLYMRPDLQPVIDDLAGYIPQEGMLSINLNGLKRGSYYTMWINFVTFGNPQSASFSSLLKVFIKNDYYSYRELAVFSLGNMLPQPVKIPIPFELSESGKVNILFEEYNNSKTFRSKTTWGIWDMIIADVDNLESVLIPKPETKAIQYKMDILR